MHDNFHSEVLAADKRLCHTDATNLRRLANRHVTLKLKGFVIDEDLETKLNDLESWVVRFSRCSQKTARVVVWVAYCKMRLSR